VVPVVREEHALDHVPAQAKTEHDGERDPHQVEGTLARCGSGLQLEPHEADRKDRAGLAA
jgi:hypothetical protein